MCFWSVGQKFGYEMSLHGIHLRSGGNRWRRYWEDQEAQKIDGKDCYMLEEPTDSLIETVNARDKDCYPNIYTILEINTIKVVNIFIKSGKRRLMHDLYIYIFPKDLFFSNAVYVIGTN